MAHRNMRLRVAIEWADTGEQVTLPNGRPLQYTEDELATALVDGREADEETLLAAVQVHLGEEYDLGASFPWYRRANAKDVDEKARVEARRAVAATLAQIGASALAGTIVRSATKNALRALKLQTLKVV